MEQISNLLHTDILKFKDIFSILVKLEDEGTIQEITKLFHKIFTDESKFALQGKETWIL